jgi:MFS transporter, DHA1 family, inner membrane transport protein
MAIGVAIRSRTASTSTPGTPLAADLTRPEWAAVLTLATVQFTHFLDLVVVMPLGPQLAADLRINAAQFGFVVSAYAFGAATSGLLAAAFIDRHDRRQAVLWLYAGFIIGTILCGLATSYHLLLAARAVTGGFAGVLAANVLATVGDAIPESRRGLALGVVMSSFSLASVAGVPLALVLAGRWGWRLPFHALAALGAGTWLIARVTLPRSAEPPDRRSGSWRRLRDVFSDPVHRRAYAFTLTLVMGTFSVAPYVSLYLIANVGRTRADLPYVWLCGGAAALLVSPAVGRLVDRFGGLVVFRVVALASLLPTVLLTNLPQANLATTLAVTTVFILSISARMVPAMVIITSCGRTCMRGSFLSVNAAVQQVAAGIASLLAGCFLVQLDEGMPVTGFPHVGAVSVTFIACAVSLAGRLPRGRDSDSSASRSGEETSPPRSVPEPTVACSEAMSRRDERLGRI